MLDLILHLYQSKAVYIVLNQFKFRICTIVYTTVGFIAPQSDGTDVCSRLKHLMLEQRICHNT